MYCDHLEIYPFVNPLNEVSSFLPSMRKLALEYQVDCVNPLNEVSPFLLLLNSTLQPQGFARPIYIVPFFNTSLKYCYVNFFWLSIYSFTLSIMFFTSILCFKLGNWSSCINSIFCYLVQQEITCPLQKQKHPYHKR